MTPAGGRGDSLSRAAALVALGLGAHAQFSQVLVFREVMAACHGTEILFGAVLAAGLGWTALGTWLAVRLSRPGGEPAGAGPQGSPDLLATLAALNGLALACEIALVRGLAGLGTVAAGQTLSIAHALAMAVVAPAPVAALCGFEFALVLGSTPPGRFARIYRAESCGAVLAGLVSAIVVVRIATPVTAALASAPMLAVLVGLALRPLSRGAWGAVLGATVVAAWLATLSLDRRLEELAWSRRLPGYGLREVRETPYGRVSVLARQRAGQVSLFHSGALVATFEPGAPASESRPLADCLAVLHRSPRRALLVGGALGRLPEELARHGLERIDAVELDPTLFELAAARSAGTVRRIEADGRSFVRAAAPGTYDLVVIDVGEPDTATVNRFFTVEFFGLARRAMSGHGVLVVFLPTYGAGTDYTGSSLAARSGCVWRTLELVFAHVRAVPIHGLMLAASAGEAVSLDPAELGLRLATRPRARPFSSVRTGRGLESVPIPPGEYFSGLFGGVLAVTESLDGAREQQHVRLLESALARTAPDVNRDSHPLAVAQSLLLGTEVASGSDVAGWLRMVGPWSVAVPLGGVALALLWLVIRPVTRHALSLAAFATGLFGMSLQVALLAAYQNVRGCVYQEVGGLVACFMVGLAAGARAGEARASRSSRLACGLAGMALQAATLPWVVDLVATASGDVGAAGLWAAVLVAGLLDGLALTAIVDCGPDLEAPGWSGRAYAWDLAGSAVGALVCGTAWIPLLGMRGAMAAVAAIVAMAGLALVRARP